MDSIDVDRVYTSGRLPIPDWRDIVRLAIGVPTEGYKEQTRFYYPQRGSIQALYNSVLEKALAKGLRIIRGEAVRSVRRIRDRWIVNDRIEAKRLVSTIPLNKFIEALNLPEHALKLAKQLDYNIVAVVGIVLRKKSSDMNWIYVPDKSIVF